MRKIGLIIAGAVVCLGLGLAVVGCGAKTPTAKDKMGADKMEGDKMKGDKMEGDKMKGDKMEGDKMKGDKMEGDKMKGDKMKGDKMEGEKMKTDKMQSSLQWQPRSAARCTNSTGGYPSTVWYSMPTSSIG